MSATLPINTTVETVIQRAWRRRLLVLAVAQSAIALAVVLAGFSLLVLLGTQVLSWPWLLLIAAVGIGLSVSGVRRHLADTYTVAQMMDQQLALHDSLSTAWFLHQQASDHTPPAVAYQLHNAEQLARSANLSVAFPFQRQRSWMVTAALALLAIGLFSARYLITRELSLEHSFLPLAITQVFEYVRHGVTDPDRAEQTADAVRTKALPPDALGQDAPRQPQAQKPEPGQSPSQQPGTKGGGSNTKGSQSGDQNSEQAKSAERQSGDAKNAAGDGSKSGAKSEANPASSKDDQQQDPKQEDGANSQKSASMMDRMRDALSSVIAKIKPSGAQKDNQSGAQKNSDGQKSSDQAGSKDQSADGQKDANKEQSAQEQSSGQQQGQGAAKAQASGKDSAQASDKKGSDAQSGVGHSDGDKNVKAAEQAQAMGKLAEIIGKRSASLTGEMQVEPSGKQRLKTGYTHEWGRHSDLGGEINRDEVPVQDQQYVREYMELVRKKPLKSAAPN